MLMGRGISFKGREIAQSTFLHTPRQDFYLIVKGVLLYTFVIEAAGTLFLFLRFLYDFPPALAFYHATYNAISAFNNCGYSLFADSLVPYKSDVVVNLAVMGLIILGGIGFIVQQEVIARLRARENKLSLHTRIVLFTTAALIIIVPSVFTLWSHIMF